MTRPTKLRRTRVDLRVLGHDHARHRRFLQANAVGAVTAERAREAGERRCIEAEAHDRNNVKEANHV